MRADPGEDPDAEPADPFADLLFTMIAMVLPAILVLLPAMHLSAATPLREASAPPRDAAAPAPPAVTVRGQAALPVIAQADGLRLTAEGGRLVPPDAIPDDPGLQALLRRMRGAGEPLLVVIEPDGLETAFLLDPVAAAFGPEEMVQVRADRPCARAQGSALAQACTAAPAP